MSEEELFRWWEFYGVFKSSGLEGKRAQLFVRSIPVYLSYGELSVPVINRQVL